MADDKKVPEKGNTAERLDALEKDVKKTAETTEPKKQTDEPKKESTTGLAEETEKFGHYTANIIRDYYGGADTFYLSHKNPDYAYRFLRDEPKNLSIKRGNLLFNKGGWQLCPKEHLIDLGFDEKLDLSPDGFLRRGDTILAFMPKKLFEEKEKDKRRRAKAPMEIVRRNMEKGDSSLAGTGHKDMKGIQTQKQLGL